MRKHQIYFVDDDPVAGRLFSRFAGEGNYEVQVFRDPREAIRAFRAQPVDAVITDLKMPGMSGIELLAELKAIDPEVPVIIITGYSTVENAIEALRLGAADFVKKPYDAEELLLQLARVLEASDLKKENRVLRTALAETRQASSILGDSAAIVELRKLIQKLAQIRCNVIVTGESGTGKELVARDLHQLSPWADQPFIVIDCGAVSDTLLESELFGHEKGAFTGAGEQRIGRLESASGGTVFLDEICNISDAMQTKLLRVVQEQKITRVGGVGQIDIDVRFVAATNRDLAAMVRSGTFREDLYHRLNVVRIDVPPLRAREGDIALLTAHFIHEFKLRYQREVEAFDEASMAYLTRYEWPGNVRELRNLVERHVVLADGSEMSVTTEPGAIGVTCANTGIDADDPDLKTLEQRYIEKTLRRFEGNRELTANALGINKSTLWRKLQQYEG